MQSEFEGFITLTSNSLQCKICESNRLTLFAQISHFVPAAKKYCKASHSKDSKSPEDFADGRGRRNVSPAMETGATAEGEKSLHSAKSQKAGKMIHPFFWKG